MLKNKNKKMFVLNFIILLTIFSITVGHSAFSSELSISNIVADVRIDKDVRITDISLASETNNDVLHNDLNYDNDSVLIDVTFNNISSYVIYKVTITNIGNAEVGIFELTGLPAGICYEFIDYALKDKLCDSNGKCSLGISKDIYIKIYPVSDAGLGLKNIKIDFDIRTYHKVTYTNITNYNYPTEVIDGGNLNIAFTEDLERVSVLSNGKEINYYARISSNQIISISGISNDVELKTIERVAKLVSGSIDEVGSEICLEEECFYIIGNNGSTISMLAKYNLYIGYEYYEDTDTLIQYGDEATGKQDSNMLGHGTLPRKGTIRFADTNYWSSESDYPVYIYDSNSTLYSYVENYKTYLSTLGVRISAARIIKYDELVSLGCVSPVCENAPEWVYSTSYWVGDAFSSNQMYFVYSSTYFYGGNYIYDYHFGVRPVIEIDADEIRPTI